MQDGDDSRPEAVPGRRTSRRSLLEETTVGYLLDGWAPRWSHFRPDLAAPDRDARVRVETSAAVLSLGPSLEQRSWGTAVSIRQPVADRFGLWATAATDSRLTLRDGRTLIETPGSEAVAVGAEVRGVLPLVGSVRALALGGHDGGPGGMVRVAARGARHAIGLDAWSTHARRTRLLLPADTLRDIAETHRARGVGASASVDLATAGWALRPRAGWSRERLSGEPADGRGFLGASPTGSSTAATVSVSAARDAHGFELGYRVREVELESGITRAGASAGRVSTLRTSFVGWEVAGWRVAGGRRWRLSVDAERVRGALSARIETWPFLGLWESLSAHAYRLDGRLDGEAASVRMHSDRSEGAEGWAWATFAGRYAVRMDRDSWYVTSFGFGRRDREQVSSGADRAWVVGGELARTLTSCCGRMRTHLVVAVPVRARTIVPEGGEAPDDPGIPGYVRLGLTWVW